MLRVGIVGASGYTGSELVRILSGHPEVILTVATSRRYAGQPLSTVFPNFKKQIDLKCEDVSPEELTKRADFFFTAVPHKTAMTIVPVLLEAGKKIVDLSADYRIKDVATYERWYQKHTSGDLLEEAVYGLPEINRDKIKNSSLTANPGCYPTSVILALAPLLRKNLIDTSTIIIDSKSGTSGAGRSPGTGNLFCEVADGFRAYKVGGTHRHIPEIEQELSILAGQSVTVSFTPHLLPISRGILSTVYASLKKEVDKQTIQELYESTYIDEPFVRVCVPGSIPATQFVRGSNYCDLGFTIDERTGRIIILSAIDNICKGASGQAVQNMNIMTGIDEKTGLTGIPFFP